MVRLSSVAFVALGFVMNSSVMAQDVIVGFHIVGWICRWLGGALLGLRRGAAGNSPCRRRFASCRGVTTSLCCTGWGPGCCRTQKRLGGKPSWRNTAWPSGNPRFPPAKNFLRNVNATYPYGYKLRFKRLMPLTLLGVLIIWSRWPPFP